MRKAPTCFVPEPQLCILLVSKKTQALWKIYGGMVKYIIYYALYFVQYDAYFLKNDDARKCKYLIVTHNFRLSHNSFKLLSHEVQ